MNEMEFKQQVGARIKCIRIEKGMQQTVLAHMCQIQKAICRELKLAYQIRL
jgi:hypothetical protein